MVLQKVYVQFFDILIFLPIFSPLKYKNSHFLIFLTFFAGLPIKKLPKKSKSQKTVHILFEGAHEGGLWEITCNFDEK